MILLPISDFSRSSSSLDLFSLSATLWMILSSLSLITCTFRAQLSLTVDHQLLKQCLLLHQLNYLVSPSSWKLLRGFWSLLLPMTLPTLTPTMEWRVSGRFPEFGTILTLHTILLCCPCLSWTMPPVSTSSFWTISTALYWPYSFISWSNQIVENGKIFLISPVFLPRVEYFWPILTTWCFYVHTWGWGWNKPNRGQDEQLNTSHQQFGLFFYLSMPLW